MKRLFFIFSLFHFFFATAIAQVGEYRNDLAVGGSAGYVMSNVGFVPDVPQGQLGGITAGLTVRYTCEKYFNSICAVLAEVNITQAGWKESIKDVDDNPVYYADDVNKVDPLSYERKMTYVQIPFMARLGWGRERRGLQAFVQAGPQIGVYLNESVKSNIDLTRGVANARASQVVAQDTLGIQNKFDYGIAAGLGLEFSSPIGHILLQGRYYYGLGDMYDNSKRGKFGRSANQTILVKMTYLFDLVRTKGDNIK